ncbi:MAG: endonuclease/exonuclease/phosphatase family protein [Actinomycetota bacterium]
METVRIATWNVWWRHGDVDRRRPAIVETLRRLDADIVGFQEFSSREPDMSAWLRDELGYEVVTSPDGEFDRYGLTNAIATRHPITEKSWAYLDVGELPPHRTVLQIVVDVAGTSVPVSCTHLSHGFDQSALRRRQLDQIAGLVDDGRGDPKAEFPPVVIGDLNAVPDSDEIRSLTGLSAPAVPGLVFTDCWTQVGDDGDGSGVTYSADNPYVNDSAWPERRLDYVLVGWPRPRPAGNPTAATRFGLDPIDGVVPSDHYGVAVDLRLPT